MNQDRQSLGKIIAILKKEKVFPQEQLEEKSGLHSVFISTIERGPKKQL